ncbi:tetratricopeptide repeat protein [Flaviramulus sp. BrNp1-15]|uniref:tetratricopeptide repeat-containing sensor histidine kinase n=1 Tax=Flaviramulus sp. BrNp1-15 TaxID=2916754 RepID=UPI001EE79FBE|nr:tetratricopeptide repeat-containing sensor histidine kinase [Flaviramulus sp. BrNp1-15]ULC58175.1 tetratricopeptide repeat protein [Flaviramulus sp. BrNp1-15]
MKYLLLFFLVLINFNVTAQNGVTKEDNEILMNLRWQLDNKNVDEAIRKADSLYTLSVENNRKYLKILMLDVLAVGHSKKGDYETANNYFLKKYEEISKLNDSYVKDSLRVENLNIHGNIYLDQGKYSEASVNFHKSLEIGQKLNDSILIGASYNWLGNTYAEQGLLDDALFYFKECVKYDTSLGMKNVIDSNIGAIYAEKKDFEKAEEYLLESLKTIDTTNIYDLSITYNNLAYINTEKGNHQKAHTLYLKSYEYASQVNNKLYQLENRLNLITSFTNINDFSTTKQYIKICDSLAKHIDSNALKMELYQVIYESSVKMNDYKTAYENLEKYNVVYDSVYSLERTQIVKDLKIKHESDLKESEIVMQQELIKTQKKQNKWLFGGLIALLALLGISILFYKQRVLAQKRLLEKQQELASEKINKLIETEKAKSIQSHLEGQNKERERIAKDLHDNISGNLAAIKLKMSELQNQTEDIQQIVTSLDDTYNEVRSISHDLTPKKVSINTFTELVEQLIAFRNTSQLTVTLELFPIDELNKIPENIQIETYSILQELLTNMHKHSKADKGIISITLHDNYINILVEDNGIGFKKDLNKEGIGLKNIKSRIRSLKGNFYIENQKGTIVNINIPI